MDLRDLIKKMDSIENPETGQKKRIDEGAALSIYGDTPEDINAMAQIFRSAGVTPPPAIVGPKPEAPEAEADVKATEEVPGKASTTPAPSYQDTQYMTKDLAGGINKPKKSYPKVAGGDNPMALEDEKEDKKDLTSSIKETLLSAYADFKKKD
tara:strand:+ start:1139 stop:1597 length:459 start_codon:yes stop_codon:yes gene_type:complete